MSRTVIALAFLLPFAAGCSKAPKLAAVKGKVTLDGKPIGGTVVGFWPADAATPLSPTNSGGIVADENGEFDIPVTETGGGLTPGSYRVTFSRVVNGDGKPVPGAKPGEGGARESLSTSYIDRNSSPITVDVQLPDTALDLSLKTAGMPGPPSATKAKANK